MARRRRRNLAWLWLLAVPLLALAAYLGFNATLDLLIPDDPFRPPPPRAERSGAASPLVAAPPQSAPLPSASGAAGAGDGRAAALSGTSSARSAGKPALPRENITERDRRALQRVLERAEKQGDQR